MSYFVGGFCDLYMLYVSFIVVLVVELKLKSKTGNVGTQKSHKAFSSRPRVLSLFSCL